MRDGWSAKKQNPVSRLAHQYLFFRIPLFQPQAFLLRTQALVAPLYTRTFLIVTLIVGMVGLYLTSRQWDAFLSTFGFFFTWEGALLFGAALLAVKVIHELAHAYTAVRYGCVVPTVGVAFMLLTPLLYTDVTDTWRLKDRQKRLAVDSAGVLSELAVAAFATFFWAFLPEGPAKSVAFMLATAGWIMSVAINLNPFMRFDGYYILSELTGIENLQTRAFAVGKWRLREVLFGLGKPCPETMSASAINWLAIYAYGVWIYRLFLFIGIAILVYVMTFKVLGVILFILEIVFLIGKPIVTELKEWYAMRQEIRATRRTAVTAGVLCTMIALAVVPWSGTAAVPAMVSVAERHPLHAPRPARIENMSITTGQQVSIGDVLIELSSPDLETPVETSRAKVAACQASRWSLGCR